MTPILLGIHGVKQSGKGTAFHFAKEWASSLGLSARERGFADMVKWMFARIFFPDIQMEAAIMWADAFKESKLRVVIEDPSNPLIHIADVGARQSLQNFGTEAGRDLLGDDFWVDQLLPKEPSAREPEGWRGSFMVDPKAPEDWPYSIADICGVTDLRFENELARFNYLRGEEDISVRSELFIPAHVITLKIRNRKAEQKILDDAVAKGCNIHRSELGLPDGQFDYVINNDDSKEELRLRVRAMMSQVYANAQ